MKIETFEEYQKRLTKEKAKRSEDNETVGSFSQANSRMIDTRLFCDRERADIDKTAVEWGKEFVPDVVAKKRDKRLNELGEMFADITNETKQEIRKLIDRKRDMLSEMIKTPPDESTRNLLSVLNLRKNITEEEITQLTAICFDNYQAVQALSSIAEQNGIRMQLPNKLDIRELFNGLNKAEKFLLSACDDMCKSKAARNARYNAFFSWNKKEPDRIQDPIYAELAELLDGVPQLREIKTEKQHLSPVEAVRVDWIFKKFREAKTESEQMDEVRKIRQEYSDDIPLIRLSDYSPYLEVVEMAEKEENAEGDR